MPGVDGIVTLAQVDAQERVFAGAFAAGDLTPTRPLYDPDVVYLSPTTRLFGWQSPIEGMERTLEFIGLTIASCARIGYRVDERAVLPGGGSAYTRIVFDWDAGPSRLRSVYVVVYRYRQGRIGRQELYYDPGADPQVLGPATG
ncbi:MAG: nuclear transport factor 2 family protein [Acidobacteriota bacterium]|nr:nuclear transport factor 2 family protein [Acidobacteriota bacterium]